jgi:archaeal flagellar protein FlaJ
MHPLYEKLAQKAFGWLVENNTKDFEPLRQHIRGARINVLLKTWVCVIFLTSVIAYVLAFAMVIVVFGFFIETFYLYYYIMLAFVPVLVAAFTFLGFYLYPIQRSKSRASSIDNNMPFAITHMAATASSGIPPEFMFSLIAGFKEYGEISTEASMVVKNIRTFGSSSVSAMKSVASQTPSKQLKEALLGISSTIETGGDLTAYLHGMSEKALFEYKIKREKYIQTLSTYADMYTALCVAAPLFMLSTMATMSILGGNVLLGLSSSEVVSLMTWVLLPVMNIAFLTFIHMTYPGV